MVKAFDVRCDSSISILKFQLLDNFIENMEKLGSFGDGEQ